MNNKELMQSGYLIKLQLMMITMNLYREFFFSVCSNALSALFGELFGQTALSSLQLLKGNFSGASLSYREDARNGAYGFPFLSGTRISNHLQMSQLRRQHIVLRYLRLREMVQSKAWTLDLRRSTTRTKQAAIFESLLTFSYAFYLHYRHWHTRYNWHLGSSNLPQTTQSSFDEIRE